MPYAQADGARLYPLLEGALTRDRALAEALSTYKGQLVRGPVAETFGMAASPNPFL